MLENAFVGSRRYWLLIAAWLLLIAIGVAAYLKQFMDGLQVTGLSRDVPWGFYIAQFTFLVGVAASAVMVVLPYYLHNFKAFAKVVLLGEFLAIPAVLMCMLFIFVDMGQPMRVINVMLHPTLNSLMFWDMMSLFGYIGLNVLITMVTFKAHKKGVAPPAWIRPIIVLSIPWAISIHTVTAFLYSGLEGRSFWLTAILAPRFLASAFSAGPALLILLCLIVRRFARFDVGDEAIGKLAQIVTYAMGANLFFILVELFTAVYSDIPHHVHHIEYLFLGYHGHASLVPWMWASTVIGWTAFVVLLFPRLRQNHAVLKLALLGVIASIWIDKGLGMVVTGFIPSPLGHVIEYAPSAVELGVALGVYSIGGLVLTVLYKIGTTGRENEAAAAH